MVPVTSPVQMTVWLTFSVAMAQDPAVGLAAIQERVDGLTDALGGHRLAAETSRVAMQFNMFRSMGRPLPDWTAADAKNPEGALRQRALQVFRGIAADADAVAALLKSGELFLENGDRKAGGGDKVDAGGVQEAVDRVFEDNEEEFFWGSGPVQDERDRKWRTESALNDARERLESEFQITGLLINRFERGHIRDVLLEALTQLGRVT